jgi:hypothetical protein
MVDYKFCPLEDAKMAIRTERDFSANDNLITSILPLATKQVQDFCNRLFIEDTYTEYFPSPQTCSPHNIYLKELNVSNVVIKIDYGYPEDWSEVAALDSRYYRVDAANGIVRILASLSAHPESIRITYTGGYPLDEVDTTLVVVPANLAFATALQTEFIFSRLVNRELNVGNKGLTSSLLANFSAIAKNGLVPQAFALAASYKRMLVGRLEYGQ